MVVVTHEIPFARNISDRVIFMDGGRVIEVGPTAAVIGNPQQSRTRAFLARHSTDMTSKGAPQAPHGTTTESEM